MYSGCSLELIGRCLGDVLIGFGFAYPKRAQKLLVDQPQTFLMCIFVCGFLSCVPLVPSLAQLMLKSQAYFWPFLHIFSFPPPLWKTPLDNSLLSFLRNRTSRVRFLFSCSDLPKKPP